MVSLILRALGGLIREDKGKENENSLGEIVSFIL